MKIGAIRKCLLVTLLLGVPVAAAAIDYVPGRGVHLLDDKLIIGGYAAAELRFLDEEEDQFLLNDLSSFVTYRFTPNLKIFSEFELEDSLHIDKDGPDVGSKVTSLERLYLEYEPREILRLRVGKLLTPIGIWNQIHAAPLVWTTERPAASAAFFDSGLTGVQVDGRFKLDGFDISPSVFAQATDQLDDTDRMQQIHRGIGSRLQIGSADRWHLATSFLHFEDERDWRWENVFGADFLFSHNDWEINSEFALNDPEEGETTWAVYFQAVYHLGRGLYPVFRYEHVKFESRSRDPLLFGFAYKPRANMVFKLEGIVNRGGLGLGGDGVLTSFAVLF